MQPGIGQADGLLFVSVVDLEVLQSEGPQLLADHIGRRFDFLLIHLVQIGEPAAPADHGLLPNRICRWIEARKTAMLPVVPGTETENDLPAADAYIKAAILCRGQLHF